MINYDKVNNDIESVKNYYTGNLVPLSQNAYEKSISYLKGFDLDKYDYNQLLILIGIVLLLLVAYKVSALIMYTIQRGFRLTKFKQLQDDIYLLKENIHSNSQIDEIDKNRMILIINENLNLIKQYFENKVAIKTMKREYDEIVNTYDSLKDGNDYVLKNIDSILEKQ